ncbi:MAG: flagellar protein FlgN [Desulfovibrionales bacterium]|nr:flagellar protein FlgN [Desulfovibrionales bacterium]
MRQILLASLTRQTRGSQLLNMLLQEEYSLLRGGKPDQVTGLEMTIQELIRQLVREREFLLRQLDKQGLARLGEYLDTLAPEQREGFDVLLTKLVEHEQSSARQTSVNAELAMALWKQSGSLLSQFQQQVTPRERNTYTAKGTWYNRPATASLVHGRL